MSATILSGRPVADALLASLKSDVQKYNPKLVVVQVGEDPASSSYIRQKLKSCEAVGMRSEHKHMPDTTTLRELMTTIESLNQDADVAGFIVQLPLPPALQPAVPDIIRAIKPEKDVDGFGACNIGNMFLSKELELLPPATPSGVIEILNYYKISIEGKHAVIVGRSNIVGKPLAVMLLNRGATVTICHSKTKDLASITRQADILCAAVGSPRMIKVEMVKPGATVIDIGVSRVGGNLVGDVDFESVSSIASGITPVPGGVGPLTVASLIRNTLSAKKAASKSMN